jgi:hypothetical protein
MLSNLGPKKVTKIGIWNVRTLYERGTERRKDVEGGEEVVSGAEVAGKAS